MTNRATSSPRRVAAAALVVVLASWSLACHDEGDIKVAALTFEGVRQVRTRDLQAAMVTKLGGRFPWSAKTYFNRPIFEADLGRIKQFYVDRGFPDARVASVDVALNDARDTVRLTIAIAEGEPVVVSSVRILGADRLPEAVQKEVQGVSLPPDQPRSRIAVAAARQALRELLHNNGYAYGDVTVSETETGLHRVAVTFSLTPGPPTVFGPVTFNGLSSVDEVLLRRQLSFRPGQPYRARQVTDSQRRLGSFELLKFVNIDAHPPEGAAVRAIPVTVTVAESLPRRLQFGVGYGSEDRARASIEWSHLNAFGRADRFTAHGKFSSLDKGARVSLTRPYVFRRGLSLDVSVSNWWTTEAVYSSRTYGGRVGLSYRLPNTARGTGRVVSDVLRAAFLHDYLRYSIPDDAHAKPDQLIALGFDPITRRGRGTKSAIAFDYERSVSDQPQNPRKGYAVSARAEFARPWLGGTFRYTEYLGEARIYLPAGPRLTVAGRARMGKLVAASDDDVPFSERYFLGGASSLRGWGRYEVAPLSDGLPIGGRTTAEASVEARFSLTGPLSAAAFVDAGNVLAGNPGIDLNALRRDVGVGLRYLTPIGLVRGDFGYQLTPIEGLLVNGLAETRHWRLHLSIGQSF